MKGKISQKKEYLWDFFTIETPINHYAREIMTLEEAEAYCKMLNLRKEAIKVIEKVIINK